jgi:hypothetical protein
MFPSLRSIVTFRKKLLFMVSKLEDHPSKAVRDYLFQIFSARLLHP